MSQKRFFGLSIQQVQTGSLIIITFYRAQKCKSKTIRKKNVIICIVYEDVGWELSSLAQFFTI